LSALAGQLAQSVGRFRL